MISKHHYTTAFKMGVQNLKTNKRVVSIKGCVGGKILLEKLSVWTWLLETQEYALAIISMGSIVPERFPLYQAK